MSIKEHLMGLFVVIVSDYSYSITRTKSNEQKSLLFNTEPCVISPTKIKKNKTHNSRIKNVPDEAPAPF